MRIGFDVSQTAEDKAGCGFVADQLIRSLVRADQHNEYILYPTFYSYRNPSCHNATSSDAPNCTTHFRGMSFQEMFDGWEQRMTDRTEWLGSPDIVHSNNFSCEKDHAAKIVYTLYDVALLARPETSTEANRLACLEGVFKASLYADHCVAISESTKRAFLTYFPHYPEERITVIPLGTRPTIKPEQRPAVLEENLQKFGLNRNGFWLGVGTIEPRKNYRLLVEAYHALGDNRPLAIAGGKGWLESDLGEMVKKLGMQERVKFLGYVSDEELSTLYSACFAFVYPSLYEGFGLPVLEAMSCGAAVITSDSTSLPEVGGDAVLYIDPMSSESLVEKMKSLAVNKSLLEHLRCKAVERAKTFSWDAAAEILVRVYRETFENDSWEVK